MGEDSPFTRFIDDRMKAFSSAVRGQDLVIFTSARYISSLYREKVHWDERENKLSETGSAILSSIASNSQPPLPPPTPPQPPPIMVDEEEEASGTAPVYTIDKETILYRITHYKLAHSNKRTGASSSRRGLELEDYELYIIDMIAKDESLSTHPIVTRMLSRLTPVQLQEQISRTKSYGWTQWQKQLINDFASKLSIPRSSIAKPVKKIVKKYQH
jgi:hypothetical protein